MSAGPAVRVTALSMLAAALASGFLSSLPACADTGQRVRYSRARVQKSLARPESAGLVMGEFTLAERPIVDGDTIRVQGLDSTLRLLALDCEETIKSKQSRRQVEEDWPNYLAARRGGSARPVKAGTPMGEAAKQFAIDFFAGVTRVRLERDDRKEIRDRYDRYLAYALVRKDGRWVNYNVEAVRAGMTPYFTKYGFSRRFHDEFAAAEKEARAARRGIWNPASKSYGDYDERKRWWDARAGFIESFERDARGRDDFIVLTHSDSLARLYERMGREATVLGSVSRIISGDRGPTRVILSRKRSGDLALVFFDKDLFARSGIARYEGEFVRATGVVKEYRNEYNHRPQLQFVIELPSQVVLSDVPGIEHPVQAAVRH